MATSQSTICTVPASHPSLAGHFPGDPLVPGVVLLDRVLSVLADWLPGRSVTALTQVKFLFPLRPRQPFTVRLDQSGPNRIRFECSWNGRRLAMGYLTLDPCP
jgi:3-hydroxyacyl-[acyl-carrier-protein] dehydratase